MPIKSDAGYVCGQPRIEGHRIWVSHVVGNAKESGLEYCENFDISEEDVKDALEYCMNERCVGNAIRYCQDCSKHEAGFPDCWKIARQLYENHFQKKK